MERKKLASKKFLAMGGGLALEMVTVFFTVKQNRKGLFW